MLFVLLWFLYPSVSHLCSVLSGWTHDGRWSSSSFLASYSTICIQKPTLALCQRGTWYRLRVNNVLVSHGIHVIKQECGGVTLKEKGLGHTDWFATCFFNKNVSTLYHSNVLSALRLHINECVPVSFSFWILLSWETPYSALYEQVQTLNSPVIFFVTVPLFLLHVFSEYIILISYSMLSVICILTWNSFTYFLTHII